MIQGKKRTDYSIQRAQKLATANSIERYTLISGKFEYPSLSRIDRYCLHEKNTNFALGLGISG
jgi:hypothetical protein